MNKIFTVKSTIFTILAIAITLVAIVLPSTALGVSTVTIRGNVSKVVPGPSLVPVANQPVSVNCGGVVKSATTDSSGLYTVTYNDAGCSAYSAVSTRSNYNASIITRQVSVSGEGRATIDLIF